MKERVLRGRSMGEDLETRVIDRINNFYLIPRKTSELIDTQRRIPLTLTEEVRQIADQFLRSHNIDTTKSDDVTGWDIFWAREKAAAMTVIPNRDGMYSTFLPARFVHYDLLAQNIALLFNEGKDSIKEKRVIEVGSGSGLGMMKLAQKGANVTGLDSSVMAIDFANYLSGHYNVQSKVKLVQGDYFNMPTEIVDQQFDVVYSSGVLEHERNAQGLIDQMARITKQGGYVLITVPNEESSFYKRFKEREEGTRRRFPSLLRIPVESRRYQHNITRLMTESDLTLLRQDGVQIAPSSPIRKGDIAQNYLRFFDEYLPVRSQPQPQPVAIEDRINAWTVLELYATRGLRLRYGWSTYYVGQKPQPQPSGN